MKINYTGHHVELTSALKTFTEEKFAKIIRHADNIRVINIIFTVEKLRQIAEASIHINKGEIRAAAEADDMYTAIDTLVSKLDKQLIKYKEKLKNHRE